MIYRFNKNRFLFSLLILLPVPLLFNACDPSTMLFVKVEATVCSPSQIMALKKAFIKNSPEILSKTMAILLSLFRCLILFQLSTFISGQSDGNFSRFLMLFRVRSPSHFNPFPIQKPLCVEDASLPTRRYRTLLENFLVSLQFRVCFERLFWHQSSSIFNSAKTCGEKFSPCGCFESSKQQLNRSHNPPAPLQIQQFKVNE